MHFIRENDHGLLTPTELTADTTITDIRPVAEGGEAYMVRQTRRYFLPHRNRQWNGWDYGLPGRGLVVYQVDFSRTLWVGNFVNNEQGDFTTVCWQPTAGPSPTGTTRSCRAASRIHTSI